MKDPFLIDLQKDFVQNPLALRECLQLLKSEQFARLELERVLEALLKTLSDLQFRSSHKRLSEFLSKLKSSSDEVSLLQPLRTELENFLQAVETFLVNLDLDQELEPQEESFLTLLETSTSSTSIDSKYLILETEKQLVAIPVEDIEGIVEGPKLYPLPLPDTNFVGVVDFRGQPIPIQKSDSFKGDDHLKILVVRKVQGELIGSLFLRALELVALKQVDQHRFGYAVNQREGVQLAQWGEKIVEVLATQEGSHC